MHFSLLYLVPEERVGIFVAQALRQGGEFQHLRTAFVRGFVERFLPVGAAAENVAMARRTPAAPGPEPRHVAGTYRPQLLAPSTIERAGWLGMDTPVRPGTDGSVLVAIPGGTRLRFARVDTSLYQMMEGPHAGLMAAFIGVSGRPAARMALAGATQDPVSFDRFAWYARGSVSLALLGLTLLLALGHALGSVVGALRRLVRRGAAAPDERSARARHAWRVGTLASACLLLAPCSVAVLVVGHPGDDTAADGLRSALRVGLTLLLAGTMVSLGLVPLSVRAWRERYWSSARRAYFTAFALSAALAVPVLAYYRLLGYWL